MAMTSKKLTLDVNRIKADAVVRSIDTRLRASGLAGYSVAHNAGQGRKATQFSVICEAEADLPAFKSHQAAFEDIAQTPVEFVVRNDAETAAQPSWSDDRNVVAPREDDILVDDASSRNRIQRVGE